MQEFTLDISEHFFRGLRSNARLDSRRKFLITAKGIRNIGYGLERFVEPTDPFGAAVAFDFPNPQLIRGKYQTLLLTQSAIYQVDETVAPWTVTQLATFDLADPFVAANLVSGGSWHFVDNENAFYLFNGECAVFKIGKVGTDNSTEVVHTRSDIQINTGCHYKGRNVIGGFDPANFWNSSWQTLFTSWKRTLGEYSIQPSTADIGKNWIVWTSIGSDDMLLWTLWPELSSQSWADLDLSEELLLERLRRMELGWRPMSFQGSVLCIKQLGDRLVVYGEDGIEILETFSGNEVVGPTLGTVQSRKVTVLSRDAVGGTNDFHLFIDTQGVLWSLDSQLQLKRLGYEEFLINIIDEDIRISANETDEEIYISGTSQAFVYGLSGAFYETRIAVTSGDFIAGSFVGPFEGYPNSDDVELTTTLFDLGVRGQNTITGIALGLSCDVRAEVSLSYRYKPTDAFTQTLWKPVNDQGYAALRASGLEFRLHIRAVGCTQFDLDYAHIKYQVDDKRILRGPVGLPQDASALSSGSSR